MAFYPTAEFANFTNSKVARIELALSKNGASVKFTPVIGNGVSPKDLKKGQRVFDYDKSKAFTFDVEECVTLVPLFELQKQGKLPEGNITNNISCSGSGIFITHYPQEGSSTVSIIQNVDEQNQVSYYLGYTLKINKQTVSKIGLKLNQFQFKVFKIFIEQYPVARMNFVYAMKALQEYDREINKQFQQSSSNYKSDNNYRNNTTIPAEATVQQRSTNSESESESTSVSSLSDLI